MAVVFVVLGVGFRGGAGVGSVVAGFLGVALGSKSR